VVPALLELGDEAHEVIVVLGWIGWEIRL
jgi:hypothetical protein